MSSCPVCTSSFAVEVSSMIACGADANLIATTTGLDVAAVEQHIETCCALTLDDGPDSLEKSDQRLRNLTELIGSASLAAGLQGDPKTQIAALAVALRAETELRRRLEDQLEKHPDGIPPITIEQFDRLAAQAEEAAKARGDDCLMIDRVCRFIGQRLLYWPDDARCDLILQFLEAEKTGAAELWEFQQFMAKHTATPAPELQIIGGN
jgi:hypothetical protein